MFIDSLSSVSPLSGASVPNAPLGANGKTPSADYNTFIKLLVAQLKNQDPTTPSDPTKFVSQLASFSAVQEATKTNKKLDDLFISNLINQAGNYVGKHIQTKDGKISGDVKSVEIYSDGTVAVLTDGNKILLGPGVVISEPKKTKAADQVALANNATQHLLNIVNPTS